MPDLGTPGRAMRLRPHRGPALVGYVDGAPERVLRCDLALTERRGRWVPVAGPVAGRVDVRHGGAAPLVRGDALALVELDADLLETETLDKRPAADRDEHQVRLHGLAVAE